ncbi:Heat shock cognate 71 kDa protein Heat shock 70 kDa protein 8 [Channa argus]|uniref:Heat shock cognate 71 kDa protein Heat shock 70 kDa protein 8 n=1 Tax=Channa argus TaxID=215402 RepID=A0A6G1QVS8_CHAAH|nr:Heat shock cognate 71 kDa protein Heat shock 70 kDa protein 8 [Channa argus]
MSKGAAVGINLETTYSCVGVLENQVAMNPPNSLRTRNSAKISSMEWSSIRASTQLKPWPTELINVTFDIDANGILNVSAVDKSPGKENKITITSDKEECKVQQDETYKTGDDVQCDKVSAKNGLESHAFNMKSTMKDEKLSGKISDEDKQKILDKCNEVVSWLD